MGDELFDLWCKSTKKKKKIGDNWWLDDEG